jgi:D-beta-D-heptose 7-phosphate kinase/D-beta-D-heptose 1-phosphate adenosyltransferase
MSNLVDIVNGFEKKKIAVVGDIMLDRYIFGDVTRISPEAPIQIVDVKKTVYAPGGAGNTASNITSLGGRAYLVGVVGADYNGRELRDSLRVRGVDTDGLVESNLRQTTLKERVVAHKQQLIRLDHEDKVYISKIQEEKVAKKIEELVGECDIVVVSDYAKGLITKDVMSYLIQLAKSANKHLIVDPRPKHKLFYKGCDFITPNISEAKAMVGDIDDYTRLGRKLMRELDCNVLLTKGDEGMSLLTKAGSRAFNCEDFKAISKDVYDVTGAGDTVVAAFALSLAAGASYGEAAEISNYAAGIVVRKFGAATTNKDELFKTINEYKI